MNDYVIEGVITDREPKSSVSEVVVEGHSRDSWSYSSMEILL